MKVLYHLLSTLMKNRKDNYKKFKFIILNKTKNHIILTRYDANDIVPLE